MKKMLVLLFALALATMLVACEEPVAGIEGTQGGGATASEQVGSEAPAEQGATQSTQSQVGTQVTKESAKQIALEHAKVSEADAARLKVEYDVDDGVASYEVEFFVGKDEYDYDIDAKTGKILKAEKNDVSLLTVDTTKFITESKAKEIALTHAGVKAENIVGYKIELDKERAVTVYEIEFKSAGYEYDYEINAETGSILKSEKEIDD